MEQIAEHVMNAFGGGVMKPLHGFLASPKARFYWPFVITGLFIAWAVYYRRGGNRAFLRQFFRWDVWLSRSAQNDYAVIMINTFFLLLGGAWLFANADAIVTWTVDALTWLGVTGQAPVTWQFAYGAGLTLALFLVDDFIRWFGHYLFHRVPALWELHKVHHSAEVLNFITSERFHPLEVVLMSLIFTVPAAIVNGIFIALFGDQAAVITVAGANILWIAANVIGGVLRHSPFWVSFGPRAERWLISPAMHQIHHSEDPKHFDRNFGGTLAIWDRWFGTIYIPQGREDITYGIGPETRKFRSLATIYVYPLSRITKLAKNAFGRAKTSSQKETG
jgi:sterol desaturase/sphingolipid hydroxylase (fatty acid hydroxylase superfamily)